jgi:hypothetical protein
MKFIGIIVIALILDFFIDAIIEYIKDCQS